MSHEFGCPGIIDQDIQTPPPGKSFIYQLPAIGVITDICLTNQNVSAENPTFFGNPFCSWCTFRIINHNVTTPCGEQPYRGGTDSRGRTRHNAHCSFHIHDDFLIAVCCPACFIEAA
jgi:hypothetical protein